MINFIANKTNSSILDVQKALGDFPIENYTKDKIEQVLETLMSAELIVLDTIDVEKAPQVTKIGMFAALYAYLTDENDVQWDDDLVVELSGIFY